MSNAERWKNTADRIRAQQETIVDLPLAQSKPASRPKVTESQIRDTRKALDFFLNSNEGHAAIDLLRVTGRSVQLYYENERSTITPEPDFLEYMLTGDGLRKREPGTVRYGIRDYDRSTNATSEEVTRAFLTEHGYHPGSLIDFIRTEINNIADQY